MQQSFPGLLYSKSLRSGDPPEEGYREWFSHPALRSHAGRIKALREDFRWHTDSGLRHPPVVVLEPLAGTSDVLVVRFSDDGKDRFGRSQTLRMEALIAPASCAAQFWDGTFAAKPDATHAEFHIEAVRPPSGFPGLGDGRIVHGDPKVYSIGGRSQSCSEAIGRDKDHSPVRPDAAFPKDKHNARDPMKIPFFIALLAFLASLVLNVWLVIDSAELRESMQDRLSQTERQLEDLREQLSALENDRSALAAFRTQSDAFADAMRELKDVTVRLDGIRTAMQGSSSEEFGGE